MAGVHLRTAQVALAHNKNQVLLYIYNIIISKYFISSSLTIWRLQNSKCDCLVYGHFLIIHVQIVEASVRLL